MPKFDAKAPFPIEGGCDCRHRETGSAFVLNAIIERDHISYVAAEPEMATIPSESGAGQLIARCPKCYVAIWSNYSRGPLRCVRVGTLDQPDCCPPNVHIFTASKQAWVVLPEGALAVEGNYERKDVWSKESLERNEALLERAREEEVEAK
ncbi:hypothetical protein B0A49_05192 [Cryomyces minteri]|uniref:CENP-V/GFA domain-containing protein n=1 Tax=Cryomyces minteri TaxID=331657 RepID=A0A4U0X7U1_9PEZI|nr:hypothetical protein B0A49_05192 [Cryomyces minteri]